jgi:hypothetical protein
LLVCAIWLAIEPRYLNLIGICLGLSIAARIGFAIPALLIALVLAVRRRWSEWVDRVAIPAVVVAVILLVLPMSHAHASAEITPELTENQAIHLQSALAALRGSAGPAPIRICAAAAAEPVVNFYRAQHRAGNWERASRNYSSEQFDYYVLWAADAGWAEQRHLIAVYRDADFVVAQRPPAAM